MRLSKFCKIHDFASFMRLAKSVDFHKNMCQTRPLFVYFRPFSQYNAIYSTQFDHKSVDGVLGI